MMCVKCAEAGTLQTRIADTINAFVEGYRRLQDAELLSRGRVDQLLRTAVHAHAGSISRIKPLHDECTDRGCTCQHVLPEWVTSGTLPS